MHVALLMLPSLVQHWLFKACTLSLIHYTCSKHSRCWCISNHHQKSERRSVIICITIYFETGVLICFWIRKEKNDEQKPHMTKSLRRHKTQMQTRTISGKNPVVHKRWSEITSVDDSKRIEDNCAIRVSKYCEQWDIVFPVCKWLFVFMFNINLSWL